MTNTEKGYKSVGQVECWLRYKGLPSSRTDYLCPFDLLVNGWRCEVKYCSMRKDGTWFFNIHRHGKLDEKDVDFYILVLEAIPFSSSAVYLVKPAPLGTTTVRASFRSLIMLHSKDVDNIEPLQKRGPYELEKTTQAVIVEKGIPFPTSKHRKASK